MNVMNVEPNESREEAGEDDSEEDETPVVSCRAQITVRVVISCWLIKISLSL